MATYQETAKAIAETAESRPLFNGDARLTAALLTVWAFRESTFNPNAADKAGAVGLYQVHRNWLGPNVDLIGDPGYATRTAVRMMRTSLSQCGSLAWYASGSCQRGTKLSAWRMWQAREIARTP